MHILVVDDSAVDRRLAGRLLTMSENLTVKYASNGLEAIESIEAELPLAVVTDLQMPEMDGLALVEHIRGHCPGVPVVVMTGHGSERVAMDALMAGAADYVSKSNLASELAEAVHNLLAIQTPDRPHERLTHCLRAMQFHYELENDLLLLPPLVDQLRQAAASMQIFDSGEQLQLAKALLEALTNAIYHGNLEMALVDSPDEDGSITAQQRREQAPYCDRRVELHSFLDRDEARFVIRDEGTGFDHAELPDPHHEPEFLTASDGRGVVLMRAFMDEVSFNDSGNEVTLIKRVQNASARESRVRVAT